MADKVSASRYISAEKFIVMSLRERTGIKDSDSERNIYTFMIRNCKKL